MWVRGGARRAGLSTRTVLYVGLNTVWASIRHVPLQRAHALVAPAVRTLHVHVLRERVQII